MIKSACPLGRLILYKQQNAQFVYLEIVKKTKNAMGDSGKSVFSCESIRKTL